MNKNIKAKAGKLKEKVKKDAKTYTRTEGKRLARSIIDTGIQSLASAAATTTDPEPATPDFKAGKDL